MRAYSDPTREPDRRPSHSRERMTMTFRHQTIIDAAIDQSIRQTRMVHLDPDIEARDVLDRAVALGYVADYAARIPDEDDGVYYEVWGGMADATADTKRWQVAIHNPASL